MERIRNEHIRGKVQVECFGDKVKGARLRWSEHVQRRDNGYTGQRVLKMELPGMSEKKKIPERDSWM